MTMAATATIRAAFDLYDKSHFVHQPRNHDQNYLTYIRVYTWGHIMDAKWSSEDFNEMHIRGLTCDGFAAELAC